MAKDTKDTKDTADTQEVGETTTTLEEANAAGFLGTHQDPVPNEEYTVAGAIAAADEASKDSPDSVEELGSGTGTSKSSSSKGSGSS